MDEAGWTPGWAAGPLARWASAHRTRHSSRDSPGLPERCLPRPAVLRPPDHPAGDPRGQHPAPQVPRARKSRARGRNAAGEVSAPQTLPPPGQKPGHGAGPPRPGPQPASEEQQVKSVPMSPPRPLPGSGLCGLLFLVQLDSPRQDMPGGPGRWPGSLREVWKNPGGRAPGRAPEGSSRALSAILRRRAQAHEGRGTSPSWGLSGPGARAWRCHQRLPGPERAVRSRPPQARPREAAHGSAGSGQPFLLHSRFR